MSFPRTSDVSRHLARKAEAPAKVSGEATDNHGLDRRVPGSGGGTRSGSRAQGPE
jgi:hypothetical protein